jgi:hypothetical protein
MFVRDKRVFGDSKSCVYVEDAYAWDAVIASLSIPVIFKPKNWNEKPWWTAGFKTACRWMYCVSWVRKET